MLKISAEQIDFLKRFGGTVMSPHIASILQTAQFGSDYVVLQAGTLSRSDYEQVRNFMANIGGKWKTTGKKNEDGSPAGKFVFAYIEPKEIVEAFTHIQFLPAKNPLDFFPTPRAVALQLLVFAGLLVWEQGEYVANWNSSDLKILEPSAGLGGIADVVQEFYPDAEIHCVELNPISAHFLKQKGYTVYVQNFLDFEKQGYYDYVLMNPPFDGTTYIKHVLHAWKMVEPRLGLVAGVLPNTIQNAQTKVETFWQFVHCIGRVEDLPAQSFKESGTNIGTVIFWIDKEMQQASRHRQPFNGYPNYGIWHLTAIIENNSDKEPTEIRRLVRENVPEYPKRILALVKNIQKAYIDSNGIACLDEQELVFITDLLIEKEKNAMAYENQPTEYMNEQNVPEKLIRFSKEALKFVPKTQVSVVNASLEEFQEVIQNINRIVAEMPLLYAQDGKKNPMVYLHYFHGNQDWYITEKDSEDRQLQAFGNANLGYGGEWGYINIEDFVKSLRVELDFHFEPTPFQQLQIEKQGKQPNFRVGDEATVQELWQIPYKAYVQAVWAGKIQQNIIGYNGIKDIQALVEKYNQSKGSEHEEGYKKAVESAIYSQKTHSVEIARAFSKGKEVPATALAQAQQDLPNATIWEKSTTKSKAYWEAEIKRFELAKKYAFEDKKAYWEAEIKRFKIAQKYAT